MILLYNPVSSAQRKPVLPMSLLALGAVLEGKYDYRIVDGNLEDDPLGALDEAVRQTGARVLGVTVMPGPQLEHATPLCRELKARHPDLTIVWGGYFPTQHYDVCLRAEYVDYVVRGHGEMVFLQLLERLTAELSDTERHGEGGGGPRRGDKGDGGPPSSRRFRTSGRIPVEIPPASELISSASISVNPRQKSITNLQSTNLQSTNLHSLPGLAYRHPDANEITTNPLAPIPHPRTLPDFPYHRVDVARYIRPTFMGRRTLPHHSSYGCPFMCNFCAVVNMVNGRWLPQSAERVAGVVRGLVQEWDLDAVEFYDNNFFTHEARVAEFAGRIMDLNIGWWGEARIDTMLKYSDETWALMRDSGLRMVFLGAESGSDETLKRMNKGGTASTAKTLEIARKMAHYNIVPEMSFVLGNPPDPEADVAQTMSFIRRVKQVNPATEVILYMYTPVPLSGELYEQAKASGFAFPETLEGWISKEWRDFSQRRSSAMPWLKDPLRRRVRNFERVLNAYYPTATDPGLGGGWRRLLRAVSAWRYHLGIYDFPLELRALHRLIHYQRPETTGF
ncbi:MAG: B12-binding domain-containing radical SAM protein [Chloroflexota bacterium]